jgi:hypothetical protein
MREIKFRGLSLDGKWIYGDLNPQGENHVNLATFFANLYAGTIRAETVGEWTGLHDKNGKEIYDGDIVKHQLYRLPYQVRYSLENTGFDLWMECHSMHLGKLCEPKMEVIGNIWENKELLNDNKANEL